MEFELLSSDFELDFSDLVPDSSSDFFEFDRLVSVCFEFDFFEFLTEELKFELFSFDLLDLEFEILDCFLEYLELLFFLLI